MIKRLLVRLLVTTSMDECLWTDKPSRYITNTNVNSAFHLPGVYESSASLLAGVKVGHIHLCQVAGKTLCNPMKSYRHF